jgi:hypothetical protein
MEAAGIHYYSIGRPDVMGERCTPTVKLPDDKSEVNQSQGDGIQQVV